jgi:hypothetical protein
MLAGWHPHFIRVIAESIMATHNRQPVAPAPLFLPLTLSLSLVFSSSAFFYVTCRQHQIVQLDWFVSPKMK